MAGSCDGNADVYKDGLVDIEGGFRQDPTPREREQWSEDRESLRAENREHEAAKARNEQTCQALEEQVDEQQEKLDGGSFPNTRFPSPGVIGASLLFALLASGLAYLYPSVVYTALFDNSLATALASRDVLEISRFLGAAISPGVFATAFRDGGLGFVLFLLGLSGVMIWTGIEYYRDREYCESGFFSSRQRPLILALSIDILLVLVLELRYYATGLVDATPIHVFYSITSGALIVCLLFGTYLACGRVARTVVDLRAQDPKRVARARIDSLRRKIDVAIEDNAALDRAIADNNIAISRLSTRLDGGIINFDVVEAAIARFTIGFCEYITSAEIDEQEAERRTAEITRAEREFLASIRDKYRPASAI